jgi:adenosylmethionine-8-amino-7-oxononanoate aminotransferase
MPPGLLLPIKIDECLPKPHSWSYHNIRRSPVCCAAGMAAMKVLLEEKLLTQLREGRII